MIPDFLTVGSSSNFVWISLSENGALSAIPTEGNCAEWPKAVLSPIIIEGNSAEQPKGALSEH